MTGGVSVRGALRTLGAVALFSALAIAGELFVRATGLPLPGSLVGMLLLWMLLHAGLVDTGWIRETALVMTRTMPMFIVAPGAALVAGHWAAPGTLLRIVGVSVVSTLLVFAVVGVGCDRAVSREPEDRA